MMDKLKQIGIIVSITLNPRAYKLKSTLSPTEKRALRRICARKDSDPDFDIINNRLFGKKRRAKARLFLYYCIIASVQYS